MFLWKCLVNIFLYVSCVPMLVFCASGRLVVSANFVKSDFHTKAFLAVFPTFVWIDCIGFGFRWILQHNFCVVSSAIISLRMFIDVFGTELRGR